MIAACGIDTKVMLPALTSAAIDHAHEDFLAGFGGIEPEQAVAPATSTPGPRSAGRSFRARRILLRIFRVMAKPHRSHAAHEAEQQCGTEPQAQLKIVGGVTEPDDHHGRGQYLDCDGRRYQADKRIDLGLADGAADPVMRRLKRNRSGQRGPRSRTRRSTAVLVACPPTRSGSAYAFKISGTSGLAQKIAKKP